MSVGSALVSFFGLVWRILEGVRRVLHLILLLVIFGFILAALHTSIPTVPRSAALVLAPEGELVEQLATDPVRRAFGQASGGPAPETLLKDVIDAIQMAKGDSRIKLIVLELGNLGPSGLSKLQEIGSALREFRAAGKRVFKAGTFKSYTDQFSRSDMAPSEREESSVWLDALWHAYSQDVTRARSMPSNALNEYIAEEPAALAAVNGDAAKLALQRGLVTALKSRRQVADDLKGLVGEDQDNHSFNAIGMNQYLSAVRSKHVLKSKSDARGGIVVASGEILDGHQPPGTIGGESTADLLRQARYDNAVKAVVLRVDSPGGSMFASEQILREVQALRKAGKPVVVSMSTYAASGGYYISAAANQIFASPTTLTGSIGVFSVVPTFQHTLEKFGVKVDGIGTTPLAGDMRQDRTLTPARRQILQTSVDHAYAEFLRRVGDGRKKPVEDVDKIAQGRVWAGIDAQRIGLVDHLGGLKDATDAAAKLAELGTDYNVDYIEPELSLREALLMQLRSETLRIGRIAGFIAPRSDMERALDPVLEQARAVARLNDPRGLYAYCWCREPSMNLKGLAGR